MIEILQGPWKFFDEIFEKEGEVYIGEDIFSSNNEYENLLISNFYQNICLLASQFDNKFLEKFIDQDNWDFFCLPFSNSQYKKISINLNYLKNSQLIISNCILVVLNYNGNSTEKITQISIHLLKK